MGAGTMRGGSPCQVATGSGLGRQAGGVPDNGHAQAIQHRRGHSLARTAPCQEALPDALTGTHALTGAPGEVNSCKVPPKQVHGCNVAAEEHSVYPQEQVEAAEAESSSEGCFK